ncbi:hypothetical protein [Polyangium sp. 15x6]|uniref:hypothetical protein n=1 Tax=Polyangium sp. 15x6 TaxID=3042687 RepID=UPI00249C7E1B|nr:hypothetical protein [Polyangium sp. 15x6]MDI3285489.1 hypothetical protein [Polyangium sp. 15x6]
MDDPFRERRLSPAEVRRILRRALELAEQDAETQAVETSMTEAELVRHAGELGIPRTAIRGAAVEHAPPEEPKARGGWLGAPLRTLFEEEIEGEITSDSHEDIVDVIRSVTGDAGQVQIVGKTLTWTPTVHPQSQPRQLSVTVRSRNGKTLVRVEERYTNFAAALYLGIGLGFGLGGGLPVAVAIATTTKDGFAAALAGVAVLMFAFLIPRLLFPWLVRRRSRKHRELLSRLSDVAHAASPGARVAEEAAAPRKRKRKRIAAASAEAEAEAGAEAEAEAEAEANAGRGARARR